MRGIIKATRVLIAVVSVGAVCIVLGFTALADTPFGTAIQTLAGRAPVSQALDEALDATGLKQDVDEALRDNAQAIADATGLSVFQVRAVINGLNIPSWTVVELPTTADESYSVDVTYGGVAATVVAYDDPSYITVEAAGQAVTFDVPESAQEYVSYLSLLQGSGGAALSL